MLALVSTTDILCIATAAGCTLEVTVSWVDSTSSAATPGVTRTSIAASSSATNITGSPAASTTRIIKEIVIINATNGVAEKTSEALFTFYYSTDSGTTTYEMCNCYSAPGMQHSYNEYKGWVSRNLYSGAIATVTNGGYQCHPLVPAHPRLGSAATIALTSTTTIATLVGPMKMSAAGVLIQFRITTNPATLTYVEVAACLGTPAAGSNVTLYNLGYVSFDQMIGTGVKTLFIPFSYKPSYVYGDGDLWIAIGTQATTAGTLRGVVADDLQSGIYATATVRPQSINGVNNSGTVFTIAGATTVIPLIKACYV